jgi:hypothetical protein
MVGSDSMKIVLKRILVARDFSDGARSAVT